VKWRYVYLLDGSRWIHNASNWFLEHTVYLTSYNIFSNTVSIQVSVNSCSIDHYYYSTLIVGKQVVEWFTTHLCNLLYVYCRADDAFWLKIACLSHMTSVSRYFHQSESGTPSSHGLGVSTEPAGCGHYRADVAGHYDNDPLTSFVCTREIPFIHKFIRSFISTCSWSVGLGNIKLI